MQARFPALLAALALGVAGCGDSGKKSDIPDGSGATGSTAAAAPATSGDQCSNQATKGAKLDPKKTYTVTVKTNKGTFDFELDQKASPRNSASMAALIRKGFFDGLRFVRIAPGFVIQGGSPDNDQAGGPGYSVCDTPASDTIYPVGTVAMAKTGQEEPGTGGSQFFVVTGPGGSNLTPDYAVIGKVTKGLSTVKKIGRLGDQSEQPTQKVVMEKVTVEP